ncbi:MAG: GNAT family N-acetyltransferase, partial [bacterium]|nr:GNAT family N-acetyltransferase [bacterium]
VEAASVFLQTFNSVGEVWNKETSLAHIEENFIESYSFVARENNQAVGILIGLPITRDSGQELFIDTVAVLPNYQAKGIGKALMETASELAKEKGFVALRLLASPKLNSFDWYKNKGFEESGWVEVFKKI